MKSMLGFIACLTFSAAAWSQQTVAEYKWKDVTQTAALYHNGIPIGGEENNYQLICTQLDYYQSKLQELLRTKEDQGEFVQKVARLKAEKKALEEQYPGLIASLWHRAVPVLVDGREALKIENTNDTPLKLTLLTIAKPKISTQMYAVMGEIRYDAVQGDGSLEMWNYFPPGKPGLPEREFLSQPMGKSGIMGKIRGTSDWRPFSLGFCGIGASEPPTRLQINLIFWGRGAVYLGPLKLVQYQGGKSSYTISSSNSWWSDRTGSLVGGWGGGIIGCIGGLIGGLIGVLGSMGKGRGFVIALLKILTGLGLLLSVAGIVALAQRQPYGVWYPLLLTGIILLAVCPRSLLTIGRRHQEQELRRMQALDASG
jgi:hypothetical protein